MSTLSRSLSLICVATIAATTGITRYKSIANSKDTFPPEAQPTIGRALPKLIADDVAIVRQLEDEAMSALSGKRRIRAAALARLAGLAMSAIFAIVLVGMASWLTLPDSDFTHTHPFQIWKWFPEVHDTLVGRITPEATLTVAMGLLALCAAITIALAIGRQSSGNRVNEVAAGHWWRSLNLTATLAAFGAILVGVAAWTGNSVRAGSGVSLATDFVAVLCVLLTLSINTAVINNAERAISFISSTRSLEKLTARRNLLQSRGLLPAEDEWARPWRRSLQGYILRPALAGLCAGIVVAATGQAYRLLRHYSRSPWPQALLNVCILSVVAALMVWSVGWLTFNRWSSFSTKRPRLQLCWAPLILRTAWIVLAILFGLSSTEEGGSISAIPLITFIVGVPLSAWTVLRFTHDHQRSRLEKWLAAPVWEAVAVTLDRRHRRLQRDRDGQIAAMNQARGVLDDIAQLIATAPAAPSGGTASGAFR